MSKLHYIKKPQFRTGAKIEERQNEIIVTYNDEDFILQPDEGISIQNLCEFVRLLDGTHSVDEIKQACSSMTEKQVDECLVVLDENWLLSDGHTEPLTGKTGLQFLFELEDLYRSWSSEAGETELAQQFHDGEASKEVVIGWSLEYYHVTKRAHDCITPAIAKSHGEFREMFIEFFREEYRHDKLLLKSLVALGFTEEEVVNSIPLPYTAAVSNLLAKWAHIDLLSFMASLFAFEGTEADGNEYMQSLNLYDLPDEFREHQGIHNNINIEGEHGNATREFYSKIEYISKPDQERVIRNLRLLFEMLRAQNKNAVRYYSTPNCPIPRLLQSLNSSVGN